MGISGRALTETELDEVFKLRLLGWGTRPVARELGLSRRTVQAHASNEAVEERRRGLKKRAELRAEIRAEQAAERKSQGER